MRITFDINGNEVSREEECSLEQLKERYVARIKAEANKRLSGLEGWVYQRAKDRADAGDNSELLALLANKEAIRARSNEIEAEIVALSTCEEIRSYSVLNAFDQEGE